MTTAARALWPVVLRRTTDRPVAVSRAEIARRARDHGGGVAPDGTLELRAARGIRCEVRVKPYLGPPTHAEVTLRESASAPAFAYLLLVSGLALTAVAVWFGAGGGGVGPTLLGGAGAVLGLGSATLAFRARHRRFEHAVAADVAGVVLGTAEPRVVVPGPWPGRFQKIAVWCQAASLVLTFVGLAIDHRTRGEPTLDPDRTAYVRMDRVATLIAFQQGVNDADCNDYDDIPAAHDGLRIACASPSTGRHWQVTVHVSATGAASFDIS